MFLQGHFLFSRYELLFLVGIFDFVGLLSSFYSLSFNFGIDTWQSTINIDSLGLWTFPELGPMQWQIIWHYPLVIQHSYGKVIVFNRLINYHNWAIFHSCGR